MSTAYSSAKQQYIGNGVTTEWGFDFPIKKHSELKVYLKRSNSPQVLLEEGVDYSFVTENTIAFPIKTGEAKLQAADVLALQRESVFESEYNFSNQQRLEPEEVMHADDNLERQIQELKRDVTQAIRIQPTSNIDTDEYFVAVESIYENLDNINNVSGISAEIVNCSDNISDISTVSSNIANVNAVGQSISNVNTVASNVSSVNTVAGVSTDVTTVAGISTDVSTVANNSANVTTVATNISDVNTAATNIEAIKAATTAASNAAQSATNAANSATDSANSATASAASAQAAQDALNDVQGLIATPIGTIFQSIYVDESLDIARQLNGQLISSTKFTGFRSWLNTVQTATPSLFTTEANWQAEKTNSKLGQCGKFVVDDTAGTIRLPCVVNAQGLVDLALIGGIKSESLPNITGTTGESVSSGMLLSNGRTTGVFSKSTEFTGRPGAETEGYGGSYDLGFNASLSSSTYQDNAPVQQEAVQYPYYIQVATGVEETLPAIREYQINTPFFFGQSMYSDVAPDNASWLVSNGQWNAKTVYPDYYSWILENVNKGTENFKGTTGYAFSNGSYDCWINTETPKVGQAVYTTYSGVALYENTITSVDGNSFVYTDKYVNEVKTVTRNSAKDLDGGIWFTDNDFVINTTDQTFRLPLKTKLASGKAVVGNGMTLGLTDSSSNFGMATSTDKGLVGRPSSFGTNVGTNDTSEAVASHISVGVITDPEKSGIETSSNGLKLYFYVGDTVQDASLINAGAVLGQLSNKADVSQFQVVSALPANPDPNVFYFIPG